MKEKEKKVFTKPITFSTRIHTAPNSDTGNKVYEYDNKKKLFKRISKLKSDICCDLLSLQN
jgi:hypothetical protein